MNVVREVGKKIRALRLSPRNPRITQEELASRADISVSFLSMIERGERSPQLETLARLASALDVPLAELFSFDSDPDQVDALYQPLIELCRKQSMTRKDVDRVLNIVRTFFS